jgi:glycosyltransferase involved in cell wall biosynthesis
MTLVVAALVRNEAQRYLPQALEAWGAFADDIVVLDDDSDDGTWELLEEAGVSRYRRMAEKPAWGEEASARKQLFELASKYHPSDWLMVLDADMVPANDPRDLMLPGADGILFNLYDLWGTDAKGELLFRSDSYWQGHRNWRLWAAHKRSFPLLSEWNESGIHCGHFPRNLGADNYICAPENYGLLHYSYHEAADREQKLSSYLAVQDQLDDFQMNHALTIIDPLSQISLLSLPFEPRWHLTKQEYSAAHPSLTLLPTTTPSPERV